MGITRSLLSSFSLHTSNGCAAEARDSLALETLGQETVCVHVVPMWALLTLLPHGCIHTPGSCPRKSVAPEAASMLPSDCLSRPCLEMGGGEGPSP